MDSTKKHKTARHAASADAYEAIRNDIIYHRLKSGAPLIEEDLAAKYGLSRTPIREALKRLENDKLVVYYPYRGCFVQDFDARDIVEIYTIRMALECACCRGIVETGKVTDEVIAQLEEQHRLALKALDDGDVDLAAQYGDHLHQTIVNLTGNVRIRSILDNMNAQCLYFNNISIHLDGHLAKSLPEHSTIIQALKHQDARLAEELLRSHIMSTREDVLAAAKAL